MRDLVAGGDDLGARAEGWRSTCSPTRKNVARRRRRARAARERPGVPSRVGPVVEGERDARPARGDGGIPNAAATGGTTGAAAGAHQAAAPSAAARSPRACTPVSRTRPRPERTRRRRAARRSRTWTTSAGAQRAAQRRRQLGVASRRPGRARSGGTPRLLSTDVTAPPAVRDRRAAAHQRLEHREARRSSARARRPAASQSGICVREALDAHARLAGETAARSCARRSSFRPQRQTTWSTSGASSASSIARRRRRRPSRRRRRGRSCLRAGRSSVARAAAAVARDEELGRGEAVHAVHLRVGAGDRAHLLDRLRVGHEVNVGARRRPVAHRREVGDRGDDGDVEAARSPQPPEHLGGVRIHRRRRRPAGATRSAAAARATPKRARQRLREPARRRRGARTDQKPRSQTHWPEEDDARGALAGGATARPMTASPSSTTTSTSGRSRAQLGGERPRRCVVPLADAGGQDEDARRHGREDMTPNRRPSPSSGPSGSTTT